MHLTTGSFVMLILPSPREAHMSYANLPRSSFSNFCHHVFRRQSVKTGSRFDLFCSQILQVLKQRHLSWKKGKKTTIQECSLIFFKTIQLAFFKILEQSHKSHIIYSQRALNDTRIIWTKQIYNKQALERDSVIYALYKRQFVTVTVYENKM